MQAIQKNCLAGYMLTGHRSMFLDTDESIGWLYHCPNETHHLRSLISVLIGFLFTVMIGQCSSIQLLDKPIHFLTK